MTSIYLHIPFCRSKCRYCGFNSGPPANPGHIALYTDALAREIHARPGQGLPIATLYFGGGTPTLLSSRQLRAVLDAILASAGPLAPGAEVTIEANPGTIDLRALSALREMGFNRISLGVQSFDDTMLNLMGRIHTVAEAGQALQDARAAGFENISLDLIFALPGQTIGGWERDLERAVAFQPEHISLYSLSYEPGTEFALKKEQGHLLPCAEEMETDMYLHAIQRLDDASYRHYEVSNFAKPGFESRHNLNYWHCGDYIGFGAGAHCHETGRRWANIKDPAAYISAIQRNKQPIDSQEVLSRDQQMFEAIFLGLRMVDGIHINSFNDKWLINPTDYHPPVWIKMEKDGFIEMQATNIRLTRKGLLLADSIAAEFAPVNETVK